MSDDEQNGDCPVPSGSAPNRAAVDAWLRQDLTCRYNAILREPVPEELLRLIASVPESR